MSPSVPPTKTLTFFHRCSYNKINQTQACQNSKLINGVLKEELDFQGFLLSDWAAMINGVQVSSLTAQCHFFR
jgi:beta-glucosidase-like glycosyl hydrolase